LNEKLVFYIPRDTNWVISETFLLAWYWRNDCKPNTTKANISADKRFFLLILSIRMPNYKIPLYTAISVLQSLNCKSRWQLWLY